MKNTIREFFFEKFLRKKKRKQYKNTPKLMHINHSWLMKNALEMVVQFFFLSFPLIYP